MKMKESDDVTVYNSIAPKELQIYTLFLQHTNYNMLNCIKKTQSMIGFFLCIKFDSLHTINFHTKNAILPISRCKTC